MSECVHCGAVDEPGHGIVVAPVGELDEAACNVCLTDAKADGTTLSQREAQVAALKEMGYSHSRIAELLEITKSSVDEFSRRVNEKRHAAERTVEELDTI